MQLMTKKNITILPTYRRAVFVYVGLIASPGEAILSVPLLLTRRLLFC